MVDKDVKELREHQFDTVIVDDASIIPETYLVQAALRFGCQRLILLGNENLHPDIFSIQPSSSKNV